MRALIRKYEPRDCDSVVALAEKYTSWDITPTSADIDGFWSREPDLSLIAEEEGRVVGFVFGQESNFPDEVLRNRRATKAGSIEVLAVDSEHRRKGVATALLNRLFDAQK